MASKSSLDFRSNIQHNSKRNVRDLVLL